MTRPATLTDQIAAYEEFVDVHGYTLLYAANVYAERFRKEAANAQAAYDAISADPKLAAEQDKSLMTTNGLRQSARLFTEAANRAEEAANALRVLIEGEEDDEE